MRCASRSNSCSVMVVGFSRVAYRNARRDRMRMGMGQLEVFSAVWDGVPPPYDEEIRDILPAITMTCAYDGFNRLSRNELKINYKVLLVKFFPLPS